jgi:hypothetical protein
MNSPQNTECAETWLKTNWPNVRKLDHDWTMERNDYPQYVRAWIKETWVTVSDHNGGTYQEPESYKSAHKILSGASKKSEAECASADGRSFATEYQKTKFVEGMDECNKKALDVMATEGSAAAVKHMFSDQETGKRLSYGEMRMRYG